MNLYSIDAGDARLAIVGRPRGHDWLEDDIKSLVKVGVDVLVSALTPAESEELGLSAEASVCRSCGIEFVSFPIEDRAVPASADDFGKLISRLNAILATGRRIAIHCRAGIGRSSLIAAALLIENGSSVEVAFVAIETARGVPVPDTPQQRRWTEDRSTSR
ncbi:MAG: dual specificity protein phosphatase family protein [Candidatus Acidiferrales bacterium]